MSFYRSIACSFVVCAASVPGVLASSQQPQPISLQQLRAGFAEPPPAARLRCYWWWLNGNTDKATITHDLEEMHAKGFGGALLVDANGADQEGNKPVPAGPTFGSPAWVELYTHALKEADRLGLEITLTITSGWNLGGPNVTPEQAAKVLTWTQTPVAGGHPVTVKLPMPEIRNGFYRQIAVLAYPLSHGRALAPQPGSRPANEPADPSTVAKRSAAILRLRADGGSNAESGFSMPDASPMLDVEVPGDPTGAATFADVAAADVQDVTSRVAEDGTLNWSPGAGQWEVLRIGYTDKGSLKDNVSVDRNGVTRQIPDGRVSTSSGAWQGLALDPLSRDAFEIYWRQSVEPLLIAARPFHSLKTLATDSWEIGGTNWTEKFSEQFKARRGYDPVLWLPVVAGRIVGDRDQSTRFLNDLRRTVADLVVSEHYDVFAEKARAYGLGLQSESGGPHGAPIDALETFRHSAVPQTEFWSQSAHRPTDVSRFFAKEAASAAHIYGPRFIAEEGETSVGPQWSESLATDLKPSFDMGITEGMNRLVWHEFTSSPASTGLPGQEYFAGTHLNPKITWWNAGPAFFTYLNRLQFLMQQGTAADDLLYFLGDNVPSFVRLKADDPAHVLPGYDYDVTNEDALLHTIRIEGGHLAGPSGVHWRALAMPASGRLSLAALRRIEAYVHMGGTLIGVAPTSPTGMASADTSAEFSRVVAAMWGNSCVEGSHHVYGSGQIYCTTRSHDALAAMGVPQDVALPAEAKIALGTSSTAPLDFVHHRARGIDIYFLRNGSDAAISQTVLFRAEGKDIEFWNAVTGEITPAAGSRVIADGYTSVPLELAPFGSVVVVFSGHEPKAVSAPAISDRVSSQAVPIQTLHPWSLSFQPGRAAPEHAIEIDGLKDWTSFKEPGIRYFSGTAAYRNEIEAPAAAKGSRIWLRFSDVREIARVTVNGHDAGTVWAKPLTLRVDPWLKPGTNTILIEVTNLWPNRIIGDLQPGTTERITQTNITEYKANSPLLPSGLIGPVEWLIEP